MAFDPSKYLINEEENPQEEFKPDPTFKPDRFAVEDSPSTASEVLRHAARVGSRAGETVLGFIGDLNSLVTSGEKKLTEMTGIQPEHNIATKLFRSLTENLPTSQSLREKSIEATGGYTAPKSENEQLGDDVVNLATALSMPAKDPLKFMSLLKNVGMAIGAKGAGLGAKALGASENQQMLVEMGTLGITSLLSQPTARQYVSGLFNEAKSKIPQGVMMNTTTLSNNLSNLKTQLAKGVSTNSKQEVMKVIDELGAKASGGAMEAEELVEAYHNINERMSSKKLFDELSKTEQKQLRNRYDMVKNELRTTINDYGKSNPQFLKTWNAANEGFATIQKSQRFSRWLEQKIGSLPKHLAMGLGAELLLGFPKTAMATVGGAAAVKTGELLYRVMNSKALQKHYLNVLEAGAREDLPAFVKSLDALNKGLEE